MIASLHNVPRAVYPCLREVALHPIVSSGSFSAVLLKRHHVLRLLQTCPSPSPGSCDLHIQSEELAPRAFSSTFTTALK